MIWRLIYDALVIPLGWLAFQVLRMFDPKVRRGVRGRDGLFTRLEADIARLPRGAKRVWFHSSSLGEFEQAKPIIQGLKKRFPDLQIVVVDPHRPDDQTTSYPGESNLRMADVVVINKMDRPGADFQAAVDEIRTRLGARPVPVQLPIGAEDHFAGVVDLVRERAIFFSGGEDDPPREDGVPSSMAEAVAVAREKLVEAAADFDDGIAAAYLEGKRVDAAALAAALRKGTLACKMVPVLAGSALRNKGVQPLLDAVCDFLPAPTEVPPITGHVPGRDAVVTRISDDAAPFCALAFKVAMDEGRKTVYLRIYSGVLKPGDQIRVGVLTLTVETTDGRRAGKILAVRERPPADGDDEAAHADR